MKIDKIRIYAEVLEQGFDFKEYILNTGFGGKIENVYTKKGRNNISKEDSLVDRIRKCKDVDVLLTALVNNTEYPLLMVEYSTAVPTDDHKMQRSDIYYWSSIFHVPVMKIYPTSKGMSQKFGGGFKLTDDYEISIALQKNAIFYPIQWHSIENTETLKTKSGALSCIYHSDKIAEIICNIISTFEVSSNFNNYYFSLLNIYKRQNKNLLKNYNVEKLKSIIVNSTRFKWIGDKIVTKINRFGHAMDPDRGILYFTNMLAGAENCITEIQVNRKDINGRGGYKSLFDATSHKNYLIDYISNIIKNKNNIVDSNDALNIFKTALNIENYNIFRRKSNTEYYIDDADLYDFLIKNPSMISKCIFFLSTGLYLTDQNRKIICSIKWNKKPISNYLKQLHTANFRPIQIRSLTLNQANEDIITFASIELYKKLKCELAAVSYPGAQGDRCVLSGKGRTVLRTYIDIIAIKKEAKNVIVLLQECKENINKSSNDVLKLKEFISSKTQLDGLKKLIYKTNGITHFDDIKISIGAKFSLNQLYNDVDYIFMFDINDSITDVTQINYVIAVVDTNLIDMFKPLKDSVGKLKGILEFEKIYIIS